jgi:hypothetical protein
LIVPVFLEPGEKPEDMFTSGSYRPLVNVLQGLRSHDEGAVELLAIPQENTLDYPSESIGPAPEEGEEESRLLLRFAAPRDPVMVAEWVSFNVIDTERQDWARGYAAAKRFTQREQHCRVPYDHREDVYPLGQWVAEQRRAYGAGTMDGNRVRRLETLGMIWDPADVGFQENLAAARAYFAEHGSLAAPRTATALDKPVGQWLSNLRRPGALGDHPERAEALAEIDPDWNPTWPIDWQRTYAAVRECLAAGATLGEILPGVTMRGQDVGKWLAKQTQPVVWKGLMPEQRERLEQIGVTPAASPAADTGGKATGAPSGAFERGVAALRQYTARTGSVVVPRAHTETIEDGTVVKLGVFLSNTKSKRAKLTPDKLQLLAELGLEWAAAPA